MSELTGHHVLCSPQVIFSVATNQTNESAYDVRRTNGRVHNLQLEHLMKKYQHKFDFIFL